MSIQDNERVVGQIMAIDMSEISRLSARVADLEQKLELAMNACKAVVEQLSPSIVDVVIKPGNQPYAVQLCREVIENNVLDNRSGE